MTFVPYKVGAPALTDVAGEKTKFVRLVEEHHIKVDWRLPFFAIFEGHPFK